MNFTTERESSVAKTQLSKSFDSSSLFLSQQIDTLTGIFSTSSLIFSSVVQANSHLPYRE